MAKKKRKSRAAKRAGTVILAASIGLEVCGGHPKQHIQMREYQPEPTLTREISVSTATVSTAATLSSWVFPNQFE
jgi:hypothetical protein